MKPWAKYEVGFIDHGKFKAITANAICLWIEGKNYADDKFTDGLLPDYEVKRWRFYSKKSVELLTTSCGIKPGTNAPYAALWDIVEGFGFKMHDYLEHNDCREKALERIAKYETKKATEAAKKAKWRAEQAAKHAAGNGDCPAPVPTLVPASVPPLVPAENTDRADLSLPIQKTEDRKQIPEPVKNSLSLPAASEDVVGERAGQLLENYRLVWYPRHRRGARLRIVGSPLEFQEALSICQTWDDARIERLAEIVLTTDDDFISSTDRSFHIFALKASWADDRLTLAETVGA